MYIVEGASLKLQYSSLCDCAGMEGIGRERRRNGLLRGARMESVEGQDLAGLGSAMGS